VIEAAADPSTSTDTEAIRHVETEQLHDAVSSLPGPERQALSLYFFEEMSTRSAADALGLSEPTFRRRRDSALRALRDRLGVEPEQGDAIAIEVGLAAWLSLAAGVRSPGAVHQLLAVGEWLRGAVGAPIRWTRETAVRLFSSGGGEGTSGVIGSMGGRAAGACATALVACVATGVVGPGVGGVDLLGGGDRGRPAEGRPPSESRAPLAPRPSASAGASKPPPEKATSGASGSSKAGRGEATSNQRQERRSESKASTQFGVESEAASEANPSGSAPAPPSTSGGGEPAPSPTKSAEEQFGLP
jgi:hypothetical protein